MSRIGRKPIELPKGVDVNVDGSTVTVKGPKGELTRTFHPLVTVARQDGRLVMSHGITTQDHSLFLRIRRRGGAFSAWYSRDGRRWIELTTVAASQDERVDVGVAAINSSGQALSARLEGFRVEDPQGSMARDYADDSERPSPPSGVGDNRSRADEIPVIPWADPRLIPRRLRVACAAAGP